MTHAGLRNHGNTWYLSVVLQVLVRLPIFPIEKEHPLAMTLDSISDILTRQFTQPNLKQLFDLINASEGFSGRIHQQQDATDALEWFLGQLCELTQQLRRSCGGRLSEFKESTVYRSLACRDANSHG
jgi:uncharacterized UBP type Zn finger protein